jgi:hypothetical protein
VSSSQAIHVLKKLWWPYLGQSWIPVVVAAFAAAVALTSGQLKLLWATAVILLLVAANSYFQSAYRIAFSDVAVFQWASGIQKIAIPFSDILRVALETSSPAEMLRGARPFRRIAIYSQKSQHKGRFIDVSLRHFRGDDIRLLLATLHKYRPELDIPSIDGHYWSPA